MTQNYEGEEVIEFISGCPVHECTNKEKAYLEHGNGKRKKRKPGNQIK